MSSLQVFRVYPAIPESLAFLNTLAHNLWWCWRLDAVELFRRVSPRQWEHTRYNPIEFLTQIPQSRLEELARDESFLAHQKRVKDAFEKEVLMPPAARLAPYGKGDFVAYFSMEFGIHESLPLFSGGLGVLAGDHLKAASDMALPLIGIGLLFRKGYFHQYLDQNGWQQETYPETDLYFLPVQKIKLSDGKDLLITVNGPDGPIVAGLWQIMVGRVRLLLLDANIPENPPYIRDITARLYAGEQNIRLAQEVLLGIGGMLALEALGLEPMVCHLNEGHCSFALIERLAQIRRRHQVDLDTALEVVPRNTVFTTHTPVAAGHDEFPPDMVRPVLAPYQEVLELSVEQMIAWGQVDAGNPYHPFSMAVLGLRLSQHCNGVSRLHGEVARRMWTHVWPGLPEDEVPIGHVTNGVHVASWVSVENALLFQRYLSPEWYLHSGDKEISSRIDTIYDEELWRAREMSRARLVRTCRAIMIRQFKRRNAPRSVMHDVETVLDPDVLTIAFARRFATYKRANLLLQDPDRLENLICSKTHPIQLIFAGKAHPKDNEGKELIRRIVQFARRPQVRHRMIFLEDYDINIARLLVQGADVWLNTPRRPFEACGTSGIKAAVNGVLNLSILDGWWCEGYRPERGWSIGNGEGYDDPAYQDTVDSQALYNILENEVIPSFYGRRNGGAPADWIHSMKESMKMGMLQFCSHLMVHNYQTLFYERAAVRLQELLANDAAEARALKTQRHRIKGLWSEIRLVIPKRQTNQNNLQVGDTLALDCEVFSGKLQPDELSIELCYGTLRTIDLLGSIQVEPMRVKDKLEEGHYLYTCTITCRRSGRYGFTARALPRGDSYTRFIPGLITWADAD